MRILIIEDDTKIADFVSNGLKQGLPALMRQFFELHDSGRELFFVRVVGPERTGLFVSFPPRFEAFDLGKSSRRPRLKRSPG